MDESRSADRSRARGHHDCFASDALQLDGARLQLAAARLSAGTTRRASEAQRRCNPAEDGPRRTHRNGVAVGPFLPEFRRRERAGAPRVSSALASIAGAHDREALSAPTSEKYGWIRFPPPVQ